MAQAERFREFVVARAGGACEYCRLLQAAAGVTFHLEHVLPVSQGGKTVLANLVLSCPGCNLAKAERTSGQDDGGRTQALLNPREIEPWSLGWHLHFALDHETGLIVPRSARAEATLRTLNMNDPLRVFARKLQIQAGLIA